MNTTEPDEFQLTMGLDLTISIGVGTLTEEMESEEKLLDAADRAVYLAKQKKDMVWPHINAQEQPAA